MHTPAPLICYLATHQGQNPVRRSNSATSSVTVSLQLINHGTVFFSYNKLALVDLSAIKTINRTASLQ